MGGRGSFLSCPHPPSEQPWDYWLCGTAEGQWKALGHGEFCSAGEVTEKVPTGTYGGEPVVCGGVLLCKINVLWYPGHSKLANQKAGLLK